MIISSEILAVTCLVRHCTVHGCGKCIARARWHRRKEWRTRKSPARRAAGRK